jgi:hypothetical protein
MHINEFKLSMRHIVIDRVTKTKRAVEALDSVLGGRNISNKLPHLGAQDLLIAGLYFK